MDAGGAQPTRQKRSYSPGERHPRLPGLFLYVETLLYCLEIRFCIIPNDMRPLSYRLIRTRRGHGFKDFDAFLRLFAPPTPSGIQARQVQKNGGMI